MHLDWKSPCDFKVQQGTEFFFGLDTSQISIKHFIIHIKKEMVSANSVFRNFGETMNIQ